MLMINLINHYRKKKFERKLRKSIYPVKLIVGASGDKFPGWLSSEEYFFDITNEKDWRKYFDINVPQNDEVEYREQIIDGVKTNVPFFKPPWNPNIKKQSMRIISRIVAEYVIQLLTREEALIALKLMYKYLIKGGRVRIAVPDSNHPHKKYLETMKQIEHKEEYDYHSLAQLLHDAGFKKVQIKESFTHGNMFHISTWYLIDGMIKRSFWYDPSNFECRDGFLWTSIIVDGIKQ